MKTLIDNTTLHRLNKIIDQQNSSSPLYLNDAFSLLQFAEHILFADSMEVSAFAEARIWDISEGTIEMLRAMGIITGDNDQPLLTPVEFSNTAYVRACEEAAFQILDDFLSLDIETLKQIGRLADDTTRNTGVISPSLLKWITKEWTSKERNSLKGRLEEKGGSYFQTSDGPTDYTICTSEPLYEQLRIMSTQIHRSHKEIAFGMDVFFRVAINQILASQRNAHYSPSPQRARIVYASDQLFRYILEKEIERVAYSTQRESSSKFLENFRRQEVLPLPLFAIHYLRKQRIQNPMQLLESARELRDNPEVKGIRKWLAEWESAYGSSDLEKRQKVFSYLHELSKNLETTFQKPRFDLLSIFRGEISIEPGGSFSLKPDFAGLLNNLAVLFRRFSRRRILLATMTKELAFDAQLGKDLVKIIGRAII